MKTLILWMLVLTIASVSYAQNVNIPDANFKNALISEGVDTSGDGEISYAEAELITYLSVGYYNISDMTGIEAFVNLDTLMCSGNQLTSLNVSGCAAITELWCNDNQLTSLDVSNNATLKHLYCSENQLTSLDVSNNIALKYLNCAGNQLTSLNVSSCNALTILLCSENQLTSLNVSGCADITELWCNDNQLTSLDISGCTALVKLKCISNQLTSLNVSGYTTLTELWCFLNQLISLNVSGCTALTTLLCSENQLTSLDISNNIALKNLWLSNMPNLYEICVWELPFPPIGVNVDTSGSPNVYFTTDCSITDFNDYEENSTLEIYPNHSDDIINIKIENINNATIEIYNVSGRLVFSKALNSKIQKIDMSSLSEGIYFIKVRQENNVRVEKLIVY
jgi:hypothetical protein